MSRSKRYFPAEWQPHEATWMAFPFDESMWQNKLTQVRDEYQSLVLTIAQAEQVNLIIRPEENLGELKASYPKLFNHSQIKVHSIPLDDIWLRDSGPIFIVEDEQLVASCWRFNAWGRKYEWSKDEKLNAIVAELSATPKQSLSLVMEGGSLETNGKGSCITTKQCLLEKHRNPELSQAQIESSLREALGFEQIIWLEDGLDSDHTDGHVDTITRFVSSDTILTSVSEDSNDVNYRSLQTNLEILKNTKRPDNQPWNIVELPLPKHAYFLEDQTRIAASYANFYICNAGVIVPLYEDPNDSLALSIIGECFPGRDIIGLPSKAIVTGGGSFHCLTQQQPRLS